MPEKKKEVEFFLENIDRKPVFIDDEKKYKEYLFDVSLPVLYSDDKERLLLQLTEIIGTSEILNGQAVDELKERLEREVSNKKETIVKQQIVD